MQRYIIMLSFDKIVAAKYLNMVAVINAYIVSVVYCSTMISMIQWCGKAIKLSIYRKLSLFGIILIVGTANGHFLVILWQRK